MLYKEITALADSLKLAVVPESFPRDRDQEAGCDSRVVEIVPFAHTDRYPLPGLLTWTIDGQRHQRQVTLDDYCGEALTIKVPEPVHTTVIDVVLETEDDIILKNSATVEPAEVMPWRCYVKRAIDTLIEHGRDDYGLTKTPLIMALLDTATLRSPSEPAQMDADVRLEGRIHRRGEQGSNLWYDHKL